MTFDFSNRDPKDPKGVKKVMPYATKMYLPSGANDWSDFTTDPAAAAQRKLTREVDASLVTLNNGDQYFAVQDARGQPIGLIGDTTGKDPDTVKEWQQTAPKPLPTNASPTQNRNGRVYGYNPQTGLYDIDQGAVPQVKPTNVYIGTNPSTGKPTQVSEYPDGHKEYDDTQVPAASTAPAKPPETEDRGGHHYIWQPNPGGPNAGGQWIDQGPGSATETPAERTAREAMAPSQNVSRETRGGKDYTVITIVPKSGQPGTPSIKVLGPDGQEVPGGLPPEPGKDTPSIVTVNGQTFIRHTVTKADGSPGEVYHTDQNGNRVELPQEGKTPTPSDLPQFVPDWSAPAGDLGVTAYASAIRARPDLTDKQKAELITAAHNTATTTIAHATSIINAQENTRSNETTQRGQDMSQANARLSAASADFGTAARTAAEATKYSEGPQAASVLPYYLAMAHASGQGYGGFANSPQVQGGPAIQQVQGMGIPGVPMPGSGMASRLPQNLGAPAGGPNAIGAGGVPSFMTTAAPAPPTLASPEGQGLLAQNEATRQAVMAEQNAAAPPAGPPVRDDWRMGQAQAGGGLSAMLPMPGGQPQQPYQPSGAGAMMMQQAAGGYDPTPVNRLLAEAGMPPEVIALMGGVG